MSQILSILNTLHHKTPPISYINALQEIQGIVQRYDENWYIWGRNQLPLFSAASAVSELHQLAMALPLKPVTEKSKEVSYLQSAINYGLSFFADIAGPAPAEKAEETKKNAFKID